MSSFWSRRVVAPIVAQLEQGITPDKVALTVALGLTLGVIPLIGVTTVLCAVVAVRWRLNQPIIQLVNYVSYPLQIAGLLPFYRAGDALFGAEPLPLSVDVLVERFEASPTQFFADFGSSVLRGLLVWGLVAPLLASSLYFGLRPLLRRMRRP